MKTDEEIKKAIDVIYNNKRLSYSYREDVIAILEWVLGGEPFDGLTDPVWQKVKEENQT